MPFFLWLLVGLFGGGLAGIAALLVALRRNKIEYPHPTTMITEPDVDLIVQRDEANAYYLHWTVEEKPLRISFRDPGTSDEATLLWDAASGTPPPPAFKLPDPEPLRPLFTVTFADGRVLSAAEREVRLEGTWNFRDIGGYRVADGRHVKWGLLYRAGALSKLTIHDQRTLHTLGIHAVCDLRSAEETGEAPDNLHEYGGIDYRHMPVQADRDPSQRERLRTVLFERQKLAEFMPDVYTRVGLEHNAMLNGDILRLLADRDNLPAIIHCTAGKDRTGVVVALLLLLLGVPEQTIIADYSLSNHHWQVFHDIGAGAIKPLGFLGIGADDIQPLLVANPDTMRFTLEHIRTHYGTVETYLTTRAGLEADTVEALKVIFLE